MKFSIIIATADRPELLAKAIAAVQAALSRVEGGEIIVVDNGAESREPGWKSENLQEGREEGGRRRSEVRGKRSEIGERKTDDGGRMTDGGDLLSSPYLRDLRGKEFFLNMLRSEPRNKAKALNAGIAAAQYEWLAFTDDDCLPDPEWLVQAAKYIKSSGCSVIGGKVVPGPLPEDAPRWLKPGKSGRVPKGPAIVDYAPLPTSGVVDDKMQVPLGANFFAHKSVFEKYGGYDENLWNRCGEAALGCEDAEFGMRARQRGAQIGYCAESRVIHPVLSERATIENHLTWAYRFGQRESIVSGSPSAGRPYLLKTAFLALSRSAGYLLSGDPAAGVCKIMEAFRSLGEIIVS